MINRGHLTQSRHRKKLDFHPEGKIKFTCSSDLSHQVHSLWRIKKHTPSAKIQTLSDIYSQAFALFIFSNRIPKVIPKIERKSVTINGPESIRQMLHDLEKIAEKRQQPLCVIIEEALQEFLDLPENYLGKDEYKPGKVEKIS